MDDFLAGESGSPFIALLLVLVGVSFLEMEFSLLNSLRRVRDFDPGSTAESGQETKNTKICVIFRILKFCFEFLQAILSDFEWLHAECRFRFLFLDVFSICDFCEMNARQKKADEKVEDCVAERFAWRGAGGMQGGDLSTEREIEQDFKEAIAKERNHDDARQVQQKSSSTHFRD